MTTGELSRKCQVLVVGAGPAGLVAGITLARYGVHVLVIDRRRGVSGLSRSLVISTRGMELMRRFGLEQAIRSVAADVKIRAWMTPTLASRAGTEMPVGYPSDAQAAMVSPTRPAWVAQDHHEPILVEHLRGLPSATVRFGCEVHELTQDDSGVAVRLLDVDTQAVMQLHASYVIAADGAHSTIRGLLGTPMTGPDDLADYERIEFTAPVWQLVGEHRYGLYVITDPAAAGVMAPRGAGDRWSFAREVPVGSHGLLDLPDDDRRDLLQRAAGSEAVRPQIERLSTWSFAAQLADRYAAGRCYLVGDAAHRMTPRGGTGMNTAIQDAFDLGWKLAWVLQGWAGQDLLETYEQERRPVAAHNVQRAGEPTGTRRETDEALPWDLGGRLPHHWVSAGDDKRSTIDLIGDGITLLAAPSDPRWLNFTPHGYPNAPLDIQVLDASAAAALGLQTRGALLARPDGHELARWTSIDTASASTAEGARPRLGLGVSAARGA